MCFLTPSVPSPYAAQAIIRILFICGGKEHVGLLQVIMNVRKSPRLERAQQQLDNAVARLEAVHANKDPSSGGDSAELVKELESAKAENESLKAMNETVSGRLDSTIGRLKLILES